MFLFPSRSKMEIWLPLIGAAINKSVAVLQQIMVLLCCSCAVLRLKKITAIKGAAFPLALVKEDEQYSYQGMERRGHEYK